MSKKSIIIKNKEYEIIKELGKGGNGRVVKVLNKSENKYYAIKEIEIREDMKNKIKDIQKEAEILSEFNCKNIVKYYDSSINNNKFYILMEYCDKQNLKDFIIKNIKNKKLIDENILYNIIKQICIGIKEIHIKNIIHRDIKPENIFMNDNMEVKIGDFGISKHFQTDEEYALTLKKAGTVYYIAPEILRSGKYNKKADMYSLGCIMYELFNLNNIYYIDKLYNKKKKINNQIYNPKWQDIINSLLQVKDNKRMDIDEVYNIITNEMKISELENKISKMNINSEITNKPSNNKNIIMGEIYINKDNINKDIQIINSFENVKRKHKWENKKDDYKYENEKEIKENVEIKINGKVIKFTYSYKFNKEGKYQIEYIFKNNLTKTDYMFYDCNSLTNLNLSNFNTQNVSNMGGMFQNCESLKNLNLSNCNTQNVTNMSGMFNKCGSLTNLNLSHFDTQNVTDTSSMFFGCNSLIKDGIITKDGEILNQLNQDLKNTKGK